MVSVVETPPPTMGNWNRYLEMDVTKLPAWKTLLICVCAVSCAGTFNVYYNSSVPSDVQGAVAAAVSNVQQFLVLSHNVSIGIFYLSLGNVLVDPGTSYYCVHPLYPLVLIPPALFIQFNGSNCYAAPSTIHLYVRINSDTSANWYTGIAAGGISSAQNDMITYIMQMIMQGLGFKSGVDGNGNNAFGNQSAIFDYFVFGANNIASWPAFNKPVPSPAVTDLSFLTGSKLTFSGNASNSRFSLYTPTPFVSGVSIMHRSGNNLMSASIVKGQYWRVLSMYEVGFLSSLGYNTTNCATPDACGNCISGNPCFTLFSDSTMLQSFLF